MDFHLDGLLNFPDVTVISCQQQEGLIILKLEFINEGITCPHCHKYIDDIHQTRSILVRDLGIFGQVVYLSVPRRQTRAFPCPEHGAGLVQLGALDKRLTAARGRSSILLSSL